MHSALLVIENPPAVITNHLSLIMDSGSNRAFKVISRDPATLERVPLAEAGLVIAVAPRSDPLALFQRLRANLTTVPIIAVLPREVDRSSLGKICESVDDFVLWPTGDDELAFRVSRFVGCRSDDSQIQTVCDNVSKTLGMEQLVGEHPAFLTTIRQIPLLAMSDLPVLITGPTGTGKELCARAIHHLSPRRNFPFVAADCGAIPEHLIENELFGHIRGAFTDAHADQKGLAAMAERGTLFLDEVDALSLCAQSKLLRFLQERVYRPLGSDRFVKADVHVIAATNRDIELHVREKRFREDLYFRLNALRLQLPPLAERPTDISLIARHFLRNRAKSNGSIRKLLAPAALHKLEAYDWPGNVRELLNVVERAALFAEGQYILPSHIVLPAEASARASGADFKQERLRAIEAFERRYVSEMLRQHKGNVTRAANAAGKERRAFGRLKKKYGISM